MSEFRPSARKGSDPSTETHDPAAASRERFGPDPDRAEQSARKHLHDAADILGEAFDGDAAADARQLAAEHTREALQLLAAAKEGRR